MTGKLDIKPCRHIYYIKIALGHPIPPICTFVWLKSDYHSSDHFHQHDAAQSQRGSTQVRTLLLCWRERLPDPAGPPDCDLRTLDVTGQTSGHFKVNYKIKYHFSDLKIKLETKNFAHRGARTVTVMLQAKLLVIVMNIGTYSTV